MSYFVVSSVPIPMQKQTLYWFSPVSQNLRQFVVAVAEVSVSLQKSLVSRLLDYQWSPVSTPTILFWCRSIDHARVLPRSLDVHFFSDAMRSWLNSLMNITQLAPPERMSPYPHHPWPPTLVASGALLQRWKAGLRDSQ